jgi:hypothetical protein
LARQIIILDQPGLPSDLRYNVCFWLTVPAARQQFNADATFKSRVIGLSAGELTALQAGQVLERVEEFSFAVGTGFPAISNALVTRFTTLQQAVNNQNPWNRYGSFYDGTSWTQVTVA